MDNNNKKDINCHFGNENVLAGPNFRTSFKWGAGGPGVGGYTLPQYL
jgi:hypothetical protein